MRKSMTAERPRRNRHRTPSGRSTPITSLVSVYIDTAATCEAVRAAVAELPVPLGVTHVGIDDRSFTGAFGCRIAIELTGTFRQAVEGPKIARQYARELANALGVPAFALYDLLRADPSKFLY
jgi:hypothetical protein